MVEIDISQFSEFDGFPIEFKEVNPEDFKKPFEVDEKIIIEPNVQGYINEALQSNILLDYKNTVVVNAAVGQGKSYGIIQTVKRYYDKIQNGEDKYLIFVASPFVSLVKQYCDDIHKEALIPKGDIFDYGELGRNLEARYVGKPIQVVTANTLLGNYGEDSFKSSDAKIAYINNLIKHSEDNELKVVFIFDEIHDAYQNFEKKFIYNLWKWKHLLLKNYVISATFNEASKIVIEYLAELTDFKIKIIESKRSLFPETQSELYLHYSSSYQFKETTPEIVNLIKDLVLREKNIDVLSYSKSLAKNIADKKSEIGKILDDTYGDIKLCVSENVSNNRMENEVPKNQFDNTYCNIGTNFKTGVSIKKDNHALLIIMPPRSKRLPFKNLYGIFSGGNNDVIQALARQRNKGEIHIVLPRPNKFRFSSLEFTSMDSNQKDFFEKVYKEVENYNDEEEEVFYYAIASQKAHIESFYTSQLLPNIQSQIDEISGLDRTDLTDISYPSLKEFILSDGEKYLANKFLLFGGDLSAYITYAGVTNQFINCKLSSIKSSKAIFFFKDQVRKGLLEFCTNYIGDNFYNHQLNHYSFKLSLIELRNRLFRNFVVKLEYVNSDGDTKWRTVKESSDTNFERQLLGFSIEMYLGSTYLPSTTRRFKDGEISRSFYFCNWIKYIETFRSYDENSDIIKFYTILKYFRDKVNSSISTYETTISGEVRYLLNKPAEGYFTGEDITRFKTMLKLMNSDYYIANDLVEFRSRLNKNDLTKSLNSFYNLIIEDFFDFIPNFRSGLPHRPKVKKDPILKNIINEDKIIDFYNEDYINQEKIPFYRMVDGELKLLKE